MLVKITLGYLFSLFYLNQVSIFTTKSYVELGKDN